MRALRWAWLIHNCPLDGIWRVLHAYSLASIIQNQFAHFSKFNVFLISFTHALLSLAIPLRERPGRKCANWFWIMLANERAWRTLPIPSSGQLCISQAHRSALIDHSTQNTARTPLTPSREKNAAWISNGINSLFNFAAFFWFKGEWTYALNVRDTRGNVWQSACRQLSYDCYVLQWFSSIIHRIFWRL